MSWYVNVSGTAAAVSAAVGRDANTPDSIKECVEDLAIGYFPYGEIVTVETQGHFDPSAKPPTGNATLIFRVSKFVREPENPPKPLDATTVVGNS